MTKKLLILAAAVALGNSVAGAQTTDTATPSTTTTVPTSAVMSDAKYQFMKCWRPTPGPVVKCIVEIQMVENPRDKKFTFGDVGRAFFTTSDGKTWRPTSIYYNGETIKGDELNIANNFQLTFGTPVTVTYTVNIPQTYTEVRSLRIEKVAGSVTLGSMPITTANTAAVVTMTSMPANVPANATLTLTGCKITAPSTFSCTGAKVGR